jgi:hypothetical protein
MRMNGAYLVNTGAYEGIVAEIATDVGRDDFTVDAIPGYEVLVLSVGRGRRGLVRSRRSRRHLDLLWRGRKMSTAMGDIWKEEGRGERSPRQERR